MGELIETWGDPEEFEVFTPNCPSCLMPMTPTDDGWQCREEHSAQHDGTPE